VFRDINEDEIKKGLPSNIVNAFEKAKKYGRLAIDLA
jgi:hypothetical protein